MIPDRKQAQRAWALAVLVSAAAFSLAPGIDLAVSRWFLGDRGFAFAGLPLAELLRETLWAASLALVAVSLPSLVIARATGRRALWMPERVWAFVLALYVIGPGLIVNAGLKSHWGRARPDQVAEFGGPAVFTPPLWPADQCARNCSFVSGEAAAAAALGLALVVMAQAACPRLSPPALRCWVVAGVAVALLGGLLRIGAGRHFLSDVVFAWAIIGGVALALAVLPRLRARVAVLTPPAIPPIGRATRRG